jgi:hypothetical protein
MAGGTGNHQIDEALMILSIHIQMMECGFAEGQEIGCGKMAKIRRGGMT